MKGTSILKLTCGVATAVMLSVGAVMAQDSSGGQQGGQQQAPAAQGGGNETVIPQTQQQGTEQGTQGSMESGQAMQPTEGTGDKASQDTGLQNQQKKKQQAQGSDEQATGTKKKSTDAEAEGMDSTQKTGEASKSDAQKKKQTTEEGTSAQDSSKQTTVNKTEKKDVKITSKERTVIKETIVKEKYDPVKVDFDVTIGVVVPTTVVLHPLPVEIISVVPAFEGYQFFILADGTIVIVEPGTLQIVHIIAA